MRLGRVLSLALVPVAGALLSVACGRTQDAALLTIYNHDNRSNVQQSSADVRHVAPTVALLTRKHRINASAPLVLDGPPIGPVFGLCHNERFYEEKTLGDCSGFLIADNLLLTAGHCVKSELDCSQRAIVFNHHGNDLTKLKHSDVYECQSVVARLSQEDGDLALLRLNRNAAHVQADQMLSLEGLSFDAPEDLSILSHPFGMGLKESRLETPPVSKGYFFHANADVSGGSSGAPVFEAKSKRLLGVLLGGENDLVWDAQNNCARNKVCPDGLCVGEKFASLETVKNLLTDGLIEKKSVNGLRVELRDIHKSMLSRLTDLKNTIGK